MADENTIYDSTNEVTVGKLASVVSGIGTWVRENTATAGHVHGNITNDGKVGDTADLSLVTGAGGAVTTADLTAAAPTASGNALAFIDSVSQDSKGKITATKKSVTVDNALDVNSTNPVQNGPVATALNLKAPIDSPAFTGTPTLVNPPSAGDESNKIATTAFVQNAVEQGMATADALTYKGTIAGGDAGSYGALTSAANKGDVYKVTAAGKIDGVAVEVGDMLICNTDDTAAATSSNYATIAANWDFVQTNLDGIVIGPASAVDGHIALFDGASGKLIKDSAKSLDDLAAVDHVHGEISNDGKIGSASGLAVVTGTGGAVTAKDLSVTAPSASGDALAFIDSVSQGADGQITATKKNVTVDSTYSASGTNPVNGTAVAAAIGTLSASAAGGNGQYIKAISESNGVISATAETMDTTPTANSTKAVTSGAVKTYVDNTVAALDVGVTNVSWNSNSRILSQTKYGGSTTTVMDLGAIIPKPNADDNVLTSASDGTSSWQPMEKSTWGTALTDSQGNPMMDGEDVLMDENAVDLWTTFKGTGFGAERAACDIEGNNISGTYLKKSELVEMTNEEVEDVLSLLNGN